MVLLLSLLQYFVLIHPNNTYIAQAFIWHKRMEVMYVHCIAGFTTPPMDITACMGSNVDVTCAYTTNTDVAINWIINGTEFTPMMLEANSLYEVDDNYDPATDSGSSTLTILAIENPTILRCRLTLRIPNDSANGTITVHGKLILCKLFVNGVHLLNM